MGSTGSSTITTALNKLHNLPDSIYGIGVGNKMSPIGNITSAEWSAVRDVAQQFGLEGGVIQNVKLSEVKSLQETINAEGVANVIQNNNTGHEYKNEILAVRYNGKVYVIDGNHRTVAAYLRGDKTIEMRVING